MWDISSKANVFSWNENSDYISDLLPLDNKFLCAGSDGILSVYDIRSKKPLSVSEYQEDELTCLCIVKNGTKVIVGTDSGTILLFIFGQWSDHTDRIKLNHESVDSIVKLDESTVIVGFGDGSIYSVNIFPNSLGKCLSGPQDNPIDSLIISKDSKLLLGMSSTDENESILKIQMSKLAKESDDSFFSDLL